MPPASALVDHRLQVVRVPMMDERWELKEVNPGHFPYSCREERVDGVPDANGEVEDAGVGTEEAEARGARLISKGPRCSVSSSGWIGA
jgi:hypothetical protein